MDPTIETLADPIVSALIRSAAKSAIVAIASLLKAPRQEQAIRRVYQTAFESTISKVAGHLERDEQRHICSLLEQFVRHENVASMLLQQIVDVKEFRLEELKEKFNEIGLDSGTLPISFESLMHVLLLGIAEALQEELRAGGSPLEAYVSSARMVATLTETRSIIRSLSNMTDVIQGMLYSQTVIIEKINSIPEEIRTKSGEPWDRYESARELLNKFNVAGACNILEHIRKTNWQTCGNAFKSKVLALLARAKELEGNLDEAISLRGVASDLCGDSRQKKIQQAHMFAMQREREKFFAVSEELVAESPNTPDGWNLWIQSAPDTMSFEEIEARVPASVIGDADVLVALSLRARVAGQLNHAEAYARGTLIAAPESPIAHFNLGISLLQTHNGVLPHFVASPKAMRNLEEIEALFAKALELIGPMPPRDIEIQMRVNYALVLRMLGRNNDAVDQLVALRVRGLNVVEAVVEYARLLCSVDRKKEAEGVLEEYLKENASDIASAFLMDLYLDSEEESVKALDVASIALTHGFNDAFPRLVLLEHCLRAAFLLKRDTEAHQYLRSSEELPEFHRLMLEAEFLRLSENLAGAQECMRQVTEHIDTVLDKNVLRYAALQLQRVGLHLDALDIWRRLASTELATRDTLAFLECAKTCESYSDILTTCRQIRDNEIYIIDVYDAELSALIRLNSLKDAAQLTQRYIEQVNDPDEKSYLRFQLSVLGVIMSKPEICEVNVDNLPKVERVAPKLGENVVILLYEMGLSNQAIQYAYKLYQRYPSAIESNRAVVAGLAFQADYGPLMADCAEVGTAVEFIVDGQGETDWIVLEEEPVGNLSRREFGTTEPVHRAMLGKRIGDKVTIRRGNIQDTIATVSAIRSKYVFRVQECLKALTTVFGADGGIESVKIRREVGNGVDFAPIFDEIDRSDERERELIELYGRTPIPVSILAQALGSNVLATIAYLHDSKRSPVHCCLGSKDEYLQALRALWNAKTLVLDATAVSTLILVDALSLLEYLETKVSISEGTIGELRKELLSLQRRGAAAGFLGKSGGEFIYRRVEDSGVDSWCKKIGDAIAFIEARCAVISGSVSLELAPAVQGRLAKVLPQYVIETLALAKREGSILWADDWRLSMLASNELDGVGWVWTQVVGLERFERGVLAREAFNKLNAGMLQLRYKVLQIQPSTIAYMLEVARYDPEHEYSILLLNKIEELKDQPQSVVNLSSVLLRGAWQGSLSDAQTSLMSDAILSKLLELPYGREALRVLFSILDSVFDIDVLNGLRCAKYVEAWVAAKGV